MYRQLLIISDTESLLKIQASHRRITGKSQTSTNVSQMTTGDYRRITDESQTATDDYRRITDESQTGTDES